MLQILLILCTLSSASPQQNVFYGYRAPLAEKVDPRCYTEDHVRAWVYFTDKGIRSEEYDKALNAVRARMDRLSLERRIVRGGTIDFADVPLYQDYIEEVESYGGLLITESKWLNAASFWIAQEHLDQIAQLPFVHKITQVALYRSSGQQETEAAVIDSAVFGLSYQQSQMFKIDRLHDLGIFGSNVRIGILDTGLKRRHNALTYTTVIGEHDFLSGDQLFMENIPITERYGIYSDIVFHKTGSRLNIFLSGDTITGSLVPVRDVLYMYSADGGSFWTSLKNLSNNASYNWANNLSVCGRDTMFVFYRDNFGVKYLVCDTTGTLSGPYFFTGDSCRAPSAVQINDTTYAVYHSKDRLYLKKGTIAGFLTETMIDSSLSQIKTPEAVGGDSKIGIFYNTYPEDSLYFTKSSIPETTFTKEYIAIGKEPNAIAYGDTIFFIWKDASNPPLWRIGFRKSTDFGATFTTPVYLSENTNSIGKISTAKHNNTVKVIWETEGNIYFRTSYDNGNSFGTVDSLNKEFVYLPTLGKTDTDIVTFYCERGDSIAEDIEPRLHGSKMLGLMGGYLANTYVGVAPGAQFLIAKTENSSIDYEFPVEEDTWISGLEWLESRGAEIVNTSLGWTDWYRWPRDFDGKTSPASIAGDEAAKRGMIIASASGNISVFESPRINIPSDAEGIITVGGIDSLYNHWKDEAQFSGYIDTIDNIVVKPEIVCLSAAPVVIDPDSTNSYLYSFGTSGATAMVSGICALLLEAHPNWTVDSVKNALFNTASHATTPSDSMGYGWPDAYAAFNFSPSDFEITAKNAFLTPYPNPFIPSQHGTIYIPFQLVMSHSIEIRLYSLSGRLIKKETRPGPLGLLLPGQYTDQDPDSPNAAFMWDGTDENGEEVASGLYYCLLLTRGGGNDIVKIAVVR